MVTVEKLLTIPKLRNIEVVAGKSGLQRKVGHVTVMEVPDIVQWLKGDDFLITSLYAVKDDVQAQCKLINEIAFTSCACIAVKTGQYIKDIHDDLKAVADKHSIPLLCIPYNLNYIDIIVNAMNYLFEEQNPRVVLEKYIKDVIFEAYTDAYTMVERGNLLGLMVDKQAYCAMTIQFQHSYVPSEAEMQSLWRTGISIAQFASAQRGLCHCIAVNTKKHSTILLDSDSEVIIQRLIPFVEREAITQLQHSLPNHRTYIGYGSAGKGLQGIHDTFFHSLHASQAGQIFFPDQSSYHYGDMEIYYIVAEIIGNNKATFFSNLLNQIDSKDVLETLVTYFESNISVNDTATKLHAHKNTIKYRLQRVKDLTGLDTRSFNDCLKLFMAIAVYKIHESRK